MNKIDKYRGCLIGGAVGDALGYAVEFLDYNTIFEKYGKEGIVEYDLVDGVAQISDDTQMTMFTANGLLLGVTRLKTHGFLGTYPFYVFLCYRDWIITQKEEYPVDGSKHYSWLLNVSELYSQRAPGITCLTALETKEAGTIESPINNSKGCGGIMRIAPVGLYFNKPHLSIEKVDRIGAEIAALTHGHELGYIPAAALVHIINLITHNDISLLDAILDMRSSIKNQFSQAKHLKELLDLIDKAIYLSKENINDLEAIKTLGEGWVAEETLAIAIYCSLKYSDDFFKAIIASVNHSGDSDSTGAVTGNILGAYLGLESIPKKYLNNLELKDVILELADDLYNDCKMSEYSAYIDEVWTQKYIYFTYKPS